MEDVLDKSKNFATRVGKKSSGISRPVDASDANDAQEEESITSHSGVLSGIVEKRTDGFHAHPSVQPSVRSSDDAKRAQGKKRSKFALARERMHAGEREAEKASMQGFPAAFHSLSVNYQAASTGLSDSSAVGWRQAQVEATDSVETSQSKRLEEVESSSADAHDLSSKQGIASFLRRVEEETTKKVESMSNEERAEALQEIEGLLSQSSIEFLRKRAVQGKSHTGKEGSAPNRECLDQRTAKGILSKSELDAIKLQWTEDVSEVERQRRRKGEESPLEEWRFSLSGKLLSKKGGESEHIEETGVAAEALYHHHEEQGRAGYSLAELQRLSRSSFPSQRIIALSTMRQILEVAAVELHATLKEYAHMIVEEIHHQGASSSVRDKKGLDNLAEVAAVERTVGVTVDRTIKERIREAGFILCLALESGLPAFAVAAIDSDVKGVRAEGVLSLLAIVNIVPEEIFSSFTAVIAPVMRGNERIDSLLSHWEQFLGLPLQLENFSDDRSKQRQESPIYDTIEQLTKALCIAVGFVIEDRFSALFDTLFRRCMHSDRGSTAVSEEVVQEHIERRRLLEIVFKLSFIATTAEGRSAEGDASLDEDELAFSRLGGGGRHVPKAAPAVVPSTALSSLLAEEVSRGTKLLDALSSLFLTPSTREAVRGHSSRSNGKHHGIELRALDPIVLLSRLLLLWCQSSTVAAKTVVRSGVVDSLKRYLLIDVLSVTQSKNAGVASQVPDFTDLWRALEVAELWKLVGSLALNWRAIESMLPYMLQFCGASMSFVEKIGSIIYRRESGRDLGEETKNTSELLGKNDLHCIAANTGGVFYQLIDSICLSIKGILLREANPSFPVSSGVVATFIEGALVLSREAIKVSASCPPKGVSPSHINSVNFCLSASLHCLSSFHSLLGALNAKAASLGIIGRDFVPRDFVSKGDAAKVTLEEVIEPSLRSGAFEKLLLFEGIEEGNQANACDVQTQDPIFKYEVASGLSRLCLSVVHASPSLSDLLFPSTASDLSPVLGRMRRSARFLHSTSSAVLMASLCQRVDRKERLEALAFSRQDALTVMGTDHISHVMKPVLRRSSFSMSRRRRSALLCFYHCVSLLTTAIRIAETRLSVPLSKEKEASSNQQEASRMALSAVKAFASSAFRSLPILCCMALTGCRRFDFPAADAIVSSLMLSSRALTEMSNVLRHVWRALPAVASGQGQYSAVEESLSDEEGNVFCLKDALIEGLALMLSGLSNKGRIERQWRKGARRLPPRFLEEGWMTLSRSEDASAIASDGLIGSGSSLGSLWSSLLESSPAQRALATGDGSAVESLVFQTDICDDQEVGTRHKSTQENTERVDREWTWDSNDLQDIFESPFWLLLPLCKEFKEDGKPQVEQERLELALVRNTLRVFSGMFILALPSLWPSPFDESVIAFKKLEYGKLHADSVRLFSTSVGALSDRLSPCIPLLYVFMRKPSTFRDSFVAQVSEGLIRAICAVAENGRTRFQTEEDFDERGRLFRFSCLQPFYCDRRLNVEEANDDLESGDNSQVSQEFARKFVEDILDRFIDDSFGDPSFATAVLSLLGPSVELGVQREIWMRLSNGDFNFSALSISLPNCLLPCPSLLQLHVRSFHGGIREDGEGPFSCSALYRTIADGIFEAIADGFRPENTGSEQVQAPSSVVVAFVRGLIASLPERRSAEDVVRLLSVGTAERDNDERESQLIKILQAVADHSATSAEIAMICKATIECRRTRREAAA